MNAGMKAIDGGYERKESKTRAILIAVGMFEAQ